MPKHTLTETADKPGMTLDQLDALIRQARAAGATGDEVPKVRVLFGGGIKAFTVEVTATARDAG